MANIDADNDGSETQSRGPQELSGLDGLYKKMHSDGVLVGKTVLIRIGCTHMVYKM